MQESLEPTTRELLWNESVEVLCFGNPTNWAMSGMTPEENDDFNPGIVGRLRGLLDRHRISRLYLPSPKQFNAKLARSDELTVRWMDGLLFRGAYAEGVTLEKIGEAVAIASSDCPTLVARNGSSLLALAAHAGRESLYDHAALFDSAKPRRHESVVDAVMEALVPAGGNVRDVQAFVACGISAALFLHPQGFEKNGLRNQVMVRHLRDRWGEACASADTLGRIDLREIIVSQFAAKGVPRCNISGDQACTADDMPAKGAYRWHSHRRDKDGGRNLVIAIRRK